MLRPISSTLAPLSFPKKKFSFSLFAVFVWLWLMADADLYERTVLLTGL